MRDADSDIDPVPESDIDDVILIVPEDVGVLEAVTEQEGGADLDWLGLKGNTKGVGEGLPELCPVKHLSIRVEKPACTGLRHCALVQSRMHACTRQHRTKHIT